MTPNLLTPLTLAGALAMTLSMHPDTAAPDTRAELKAAFATVSGQLLASATMVPAERYDHRPAKDVRPFLRLVAHVADGNDYYCRLARGEAVEWAETVERGVTTRDEAIAALRRSIASCEEALARPDVRLGPMIEGLAHASLHYGNAIVYLRSLGMTPPSST